VTITDNKHTQPIQAKGIESTQTVEVAIPLPLDCTFHYAVPAKLLSLVRPGPRVFVPFGRRKITAYILGFSNPPEDQQLKELLEVLDEEPLWTEAELTFFRWIADYYQHPLGEVLKTALPAGINLQSRHNNGAENIIGGKKVRKERIFAATESTEPAKIKGKGLDILEFLRQTGPTASAELRQRFGECSPNLKRLIQLGLARMSEREIYRDPFAGLTVVPDSHKVLMQHQANASSSLAIARVGPESSTAKW